MTKLDIINSFKEKKILLIGDAILDVYVYGKAIGKSLETPTIEAEETNISIFFGGASSVASHILELGGSLIYFSLVGEDKEAKYYNSFAHPKLNKNFLIDQNRKTTVKKRFWIDGYKLLQVNRVDNQAIDVELEKKLIELIDSPAKNVDLIIVLDAQHGLLTKRLISQLIELAKKNQKPLYVDSQISHKGSNHHFYRGADCLFFSQKEAEIVNLSFDIRNPEVSLNLLRERLGISNVVVKLGEEGSIALFNGKHIKSFPYKVKAVDTCGAGDAFLAAFSLGERNQVEESLAIANIWAGLSTTIQGTKPPDKQDLIAICQRDGS